MNSVAVLYARVSSADQAENFSISAQIKSLHEYAKKNNYKIIKEFIDVETAKRAGRKEFTAMLKFIKEQPAGVQVLVEKTDRLLRNITDYATLDNLILHNNLTVHLIKENAILHKDSRSNEKFIFGIKALMAKNYVDNLSEEVKKGMDEKASQGVYPSVVCWGYTNVRENGKSIIKVDPQAAPYIIKMFELFASGIYSLRTLREKMLADGMIYKGGKKFYLSTLLTILHNEFYTGIFIWKGKRYENATHEPLISKELFQRVQNVLTGPPKSKSRKGLFPFTNLITCGLCGCKFTADIKKEKYCYYKCTGSKGRCKQDYLKQEEVDNLFFDLFTKIHITEEVKNIIIQTLREIFKDKIAYHNNAVDQLHQHIKRLQNRIDQAYLDKLDRKITEEFWQSKTTEWSTEKENLMIKLSAMQKTDMHFVENAEFILELARNAAQMFKTASVEKKRRIVNILTSNCIYKDGNIDVELKPVFGLILNSVQTKEWCAW